MAVQHKTTKPIIYHQILKARLDLLYEKIIFSLFATLLSATLMLIGLYHYINSTLLISWYCITLGIIIIRLGFMKYYQNKKQNLKLHFTLFIIGLSIAAIMWGALASVLMPPNAYLQQMFIIVCLTLLTAGSLQALQASFFASTSYPILCMSPLMIWLFFQHDSIYFFIGIGVCFFIAYTLIVAWRSYLMVIEMLTLRFKNTELISTLYVANEHLTQLNESLSESQHRFQSSFDFATIGMALVSLDGAWLKVNRSLCHLLGYTEHEMLQLNYQTITYPDDVQTDLNHMKQLLEGKTESYQIEKRYVHKNREVTWFLLSISLVKNQKDQPLYFIAQIQDIDAKKNAEAALQHLAYHDSLTNIANRALLEKNFQQLILASQNKKYCLALLLIDIDNFKNINDTLGHDVGDELLKETASILQRTLLPKDKVARLGGDEFVALISDNADEKMISELAHQIIKSIMEPMALNDYKVSATISMGISFYPDDGDTLPTLLKCADLALYRAKESGRNNFQLYKKL